MANVWCSEWERWDELGAWLLNNKNNDKNMELFWFLQGFAHTIENPQGASSRKRAFGLDWNKIFNQRRVENHYYHPFFTKMKTINFASSRGTFIVTCWISPLYGFIPVSVISIQNVSVLLIYTHFCENIEMENSTCKWFHNYE